ncbi:MAG: bifunctional hydroxymethylpyrimidine kinase/phosphomethylpyrimidine kinase [Deltaproteobacteria bacterium]|nr:bifunctional hydroxymethylpyrimidine kinase/phosphomethylpyrimidine kinase [Deltaproteobacteria bacterium]
MNGRVLIVAGSDSGGGAGLQADVKTVTALGGYAATAVTAVTAQNTEGVFGIHAVPPGFVAYQLELVLDDLGADAIKTGMLATAEVIDAVVEVLARLAPDVPLVVDPVMAAKGGHALLEPAAARTLRERLVPRAMVVTPNLPEAEALTGRPVGDPAARLAAARALLDLGPRAVLLKGGHADGSDVVDLLVTRDGVRSFSSPRLETRHTHGTGCTLASAIAVGLAQGLALEHAVARARSYVLQALRSAPGYGRGHGPLDHGHTVRPFDGDGT